MKAIACHAAGLLGGPLTCGDTVYHIELDGFLNPQPTPERTKTMRHFAATLCSRPISEARAAQLEWPGWEVAPVEEAAPVVAEVAVDAAPTVEVAAEVVDYAALEWNDFKAHAKSLGITTYKRSRDEILADLAELDKQ